MPHALGTHTAERHSDTVHATCESYIDNAMPIDNILTFYLLTYLQANSAFTVLTASSKPGRLTNSCKYVSPLPSHTVYLLSHKPDRQSDATKDAYVCSI